MAALQRPLHFVLRQARISQRLTLPSIQTVSVLQKKPILQHQPSRNAGHSKWQNIRHIKAAKDKQKMDVITKMLARIRIAIKEGGGADPKLNSVLARAIAEADAKDVPKSTVMNALKKATEKKTVYNAVVVEMMGPSGCGLIVELLSEKPLATRQQMRGIVKPFPGVKVVEPGQIMHSFDYKGVVQIAVSDPNNVDMDEALELAIDAGAEEVTQEKDEEKTVLQFTSDPRDLHKVKSFLESNGHTVTYHRHDYIPNVYAKLSDPEQDMLSKFLDKLENHDDVIKVTDNVLVD